MLAKGFGHGEEDATLVDGISVHKVKLAIGMWLIVGIQAVQVHRSQEDGVLQCVLGKITQVDTARI